MEGIEINTNDVVVLFLACENYFIVFTTVLCNWDFSPRKIRVAFPRESQSDRAELPNLQCMLGDLVFP